MQPAIECIDVGRIYSSRNLLGKKQEKVALKNLNLSIESGIVFGLLGPNGSGKTTTVRVLSTLLTPTTGQAKVKGFNVVSQSSEVRKNIGLILGGDKGFYGWLNGTENLEYFAALNYMPRDRSKKRINEVLELVRLNTVKQQVRQYSRGMRQRLHVARGLLTEAEILFMDEPTIGLDPEGAQELRQLIPELTARGKTILLTTHYMLEADQLCNRIAIINNGHIIAAGTPSEIKKKFSKTSIMEVILKQSILQADQKLNVIPGITRVTSSSDGPLQRLILHVTPGADVKDRVSEACGNGNVESIINRDPTLEEAYLSIIK